MIAYCVCVCVLHKTVQVTVSSAIDTFSCFHSKLLKYKQMVCLGKAFRLHFLIKTPGYTQKYQILCLLISYQSVLLHSTYFHKLFLVRLTVRNLN